MEKAIAYYRVSSKGQEDNFSLPAQEKLANEYAEKHNLKIVKYWSAAESAWEKGRKEFNAMIQFAMAHPEVQHILFYDLSRVTRNDDDKTTIYGMIKIYHKQVHFVGTNSMLNIDDSDGEFVNDVMVALNKKYSGDLSRRSKMGMKEKASQGLYPSHSPSGYLNNREKGTIEVDEPRAKILTEAFKMAASGNYSVPMIREWMKKQGFTTKKGLPLEAQSSLYKMLSNPVYYGSFKWSGIMYQGVHTPLISKELFDRVQGVISRKVPTTRPSSTNTFPYNNLIVCADCGCKVGGELKKGKYVYYHCYSSKGRHSGAYLPEGRLEALLSESVANIALPDAKFRLLDDGLKVDTQNDVQMDKDKVVLLTAEKSKLEKRIRRMYEDNIDGKIDDKMWASMKAEYQNKVADIDAELSRMASTGYHYSEGIKILELAKNVKSLWEVASREEKAQILKLLASNFSLKGEKLIPVYRKPFSMMVKIDDNLEWYRYGESNSNYRIENPVS